MNRTCLDCKHFDFDGGSPGYSEWTPGSDMSISCLKGKWSIGIGDYLETFRRHMSSANACTDFEQYILGGAK